MEEILISLAAGIVGAAVAPAIFHFLGKRIESIVTKKNNLLRIKDECGNIKLLTYQGKFDEAAIKSLLNEEYIFEDKVEKIFQAYKKKHHSFEFNRNSFADFIVKVNDKIIAVEVKTANNLPEKKYLSLLEQKHPEIERVVFIFNSPVPKTYYDEYKNNNKIQFISSPKERALKEKITNVLGGQAVDSA